MRNGPRARKAKALVAVWTRRASLSAVASIFVALGLWAAWAKAVPFVTDHDYFRLRSIRISSDETRVAPQTLAEIAGLYEDSSLWDVDPQAIREELHSASWVREATVTRHFPWQVSLSVSRRQAAAAAVAGDRAFLVDREGVLFREVEEGSAHDLPYLTGWDAAESQAEKAARLRALLAVLGAASDRGVELSEVHMAEDGTVWIYAVGVKASVRIGAVERAATGLERLAIAVKELGPLADRARVIDTDYPDRIVIRGADDKLPAMLAAQTDKALAPRAAADETSDARGGGPAAGEARPGKAAGAALKPKTT
jgi:cell division septal protein FtsQ